MAKKPTSVVGVADLGRSVAFYRDGLRLPVESPDDDIAIVEPEGWPLLLAGPDAGDLTRYLADIHETVKPGTTIHRFSPDIDRLCRDIRERSLAPELHETAWGDRTLTIRDPDGYEVSFWTSPNRTVEQTIRLYASGPDEVEKALSGLSDEALNWKLSQDEWSIREIVHHIVDSDAMSLFRVKMALAEPGRVVLGNSYHPDTWATSLDYASRDIAPALALLRATRQHILELLSHLPNAVDRSISNAEGESTTVETFVSMLASHLMIHVDQINEARQAMTDRA